MNTISSRLLHAIEASGLDAQTICALAKITKGALSQWKNDGVSSEHAKDATVARLCDVLGIRRDWLMEGKPPMRPGGGSEAATEVPLWGARAAAGIGANNEDAAPIGSLLFRTKSLRKRGIAEPHAVYVNGDSMRPRLRSGDTIIYDHADTTIKPGKVYVVDLDGETLVKRLYTEQDGSVRIVSDNAQADPEWRDRVRARGELKVAGRVRWVGSWED